MIFGHAKKSIKERFPEMEQKIVGGFYLLRFICPAIVAPDTYNLVKNCTPPNRNARRGLILISKVIQSLSNFQDFDGQNKEEYMQFANEFIIQNVDAMGKFFDSISDYLPPKSNDSHLAKIKLTEPEREEYIKKMYYHCKDRIDRFERVLMNDKPLFTQLKQAIDEIAAKVDIEEKQRKKKNSDLLLLDS